MDDILTFDFETEGIVGNPIARPPKPVGVAIKRGREPSKYYAWGHPTGNNCTWLQGRAALLQALRDCPTWLAHNAPFEAAILREHFKVTKANPTNFHDTQYLVFFYDPYAHTLSLKPSAERILGLPPSEQTELMNWVLAHVPQAKKSDWGAYISKAPGDLVGRYACGDTDRTYDLFVHCYAYAEQQKMLHAYERELRLAPILSESSVRGVRVNQELLANDIKKYHAAKATAEAYIHRALGDFNIDSDREFAEALDKAGQITEWVLTPTGKRSTARKNLVGRVKDPKLLEYIAYRGALSTCLGTFAEPWLVAASANAGRLHPQWNQVRGDRGTDGDLSGTRTGRMSCRDPNLQNIPNDFEGLAIPDGLPPMIEMRRYLQPEEGHVWLKRDFSAQEMRIMAHFAEGRLFDAFRADPSTDPHVAVQKLIKQMLNIDMPRKYVKITGFGIMYGRGIPNLSAALGVPVEEGKAVRDAYFRALPEVRELSYDTRDAGKSGRGIRTWGGRIYYREPDPTGRDLSYKLLNYLIQGSAADQTKQAMIDWYEAAPAGHQLIAAVHDEINISVPVEEQQRGMALLRQHMDADRFDVPFASEGYAGPNWADIEEYE